MIWGSSGNRVGSCWGVAGVIGLQEGVGMTRAAVESRRLVMGDAHCGGSNLAGRVSTTGTTLTLQVRVSNGEPGGMGVNEDN